MPLSHFMRVVPLVSRRLAGPAAVQPARGFFSPWPRTDVAALVRDMDRQMERLERQVLRAAPAWFQPPASSPLHAIDDTKEGGRQYRVAVDLAGFKPEEVELALDGRLLTISARCERSGRDGGSFAQEVTRTIALPETVDTDSITSLLHHDGVLAIEAPFKELPPREEPRSIPIARKGVSVEQQQQQPGKAEQAESSSSAQASST